MIPAKVELVDVVRYLRNNRDKKFGYKSYTSYTRNCLMAAMFNDIYGSNKMQFDGRVVLITHPNREPTIVAEVTEVLESNIREFDKATGFFSNTNDIRTITGQEILELWRHA